MTKHRASREKRRTEPKLGRQSIGIHELKAKASAIIDDVKDRARSRTGSAARLAKQYAPTIGQLPNTVD